MPYGAAIVIGTDHPDIEGLASRLHAWVPDTAIYYDKIQQIKRKNPEYSSERGVTIYHYEPGETPEDTLLSLLVTVDMHHGDFSHDPPWSFMEVYGVKPTPAIKEAFAEYGATIFRDTGDGFIVRRPT
jgi:hypothetical protein